MQGFLLRIPHFLFCPRHFSVRTPCSPALAPLSLLWFIIGLSQLPAGEGHCCQRRNRLSQTVLSQRKSLCSAFLVITLQKKKVFSTVNNVYSALAFTWNSRNYHCPWGIFMGWIAYCCPRESDSFVQLHNLQKTRNLLWLIFREPEGQFLSYIPQKLELKACPVHCLLEMYNSCWKEWSFAENRIRNSLFFTNTKTTKFISFLSHFPPPSQKEG